MSAPHADRDGSEQPTTSGLTTGMFDTFVRPCLDCGTTIHVVSGQEQPHECPDLPATDRLAYAWWQGHDTAKAANPSPDSWVAHANELQAEVARLRAEINDRESERADLRDRVTKAEAEMTGHSIEARIHLEQACELVAQARDELNAGTDPARALSAAATATAHTQIAVALAVFREEGDVT